MTTKAKFDKREKTILVTGATGYQGGAVALALLLNAGWKVRALVREETNSATRTLMGKGAELVTGDRDDRDSLVKALKGVYGVFSVLTSTTGGPEDEIREGNALADLAGDAGIEHFIYSSVAGADRGTGVSFFESKETIERHIREIGLPATIVRPSFFMHNLRAPEMYASIMNGTLALAVKSERPVQMLAVEDLGEFVRIAFENPGEYIGKTIELAGDELTMPQVALALSRRLGKIVQYTQQPIEDVRRFNADMARMFEWMNGHRDRVDIAALCIAHPGMMSFETWLRMTKWAKAA